jgi:outer membrane protein
MHYPLVNSLKVVAWFLAVAFLTGETVAQTEDYSKPRSHLPNLIAPYSPRHVPEPNFANSSRIDQLVHEGKLMLSLDDAIALALENNLDIAIARYNLSIADTDILRSKAGQSTRGVNTGLVQGTPGGGVGSIGAGGIGTSGTGASGGGAGGTTSGTGGAGTGSSGLVQSTLGVGPPIGNYDPVFSSGLSLEHSSQPLSNTIFTGVPKLQQNTVTGNFGLQQAFSTGTQYNLTFNNSRQATNSIFNTLEPQLNSTLRVTFQQHLLQGLSLNANRRFITIAKNNREISDVSFRNQVTSTVSQIQNIYWDLVSAYEDVNVKQRSVELAGKTLSDNRKQVEIGTLAPIEIVRAESEVAARNQDLIVSQTTLQLQELLMKNAVTKNMADPLLSSARVVPVDTMSLPATEPVVPVQDMITDALSHRPELAQSRIDLTNREITKKAASNELLPSVDLVAWYGSSALAGDQNIAFTCGQPGADPNRCVAPGSIPRRGFGNAFATLFGYDFPDYAVGFNVNIPIRNRSAQADQVRSELEYRQAQMLLQQLQNQVGIEVRNAQFTVTQNRARVEAALKGRQLAQQSLDAEQKKYALGASTNTLVLQAQRDLAQSASNVVTALAAYEKSRVELDRVTGLTLSHNGIQMSDAEAGKVQNMPHVPGVMQRPDQIQVTPSGTPPSSTSVTPQNPPSPQQAPVQQQQPPPPPQPQR